MLRPPPQPFVQVKTEEELTQLGEFLRKQAQDHPATPASVVADSKTPAGVFNNPCFVGMKMLYKGMIFSIKLTLDDAGAVKLLHMSIIRLVEADMNVQQAPVDEQMAVHIASVFLDTDASDKTKVPRMITPAQVRHFMLPCFHPNAVPVDGNDDVALVELASAMRSAAESDKVDHDPGRLTIAEAKEQALKSGGSMLDKGVVRIVSFGDEKVTTILTVDTYEPPSRWHLSLSCTAMLMAGDAALITDLPPVVSDTSAARLAQAILGDGYEEITVLTAIPNVRHFALPFNDSPAA